MPIEQVIEKRRKLVSDMCDQLIVSSKLSAKVSPSWAALRGAMGDAAIDAAERFLHVLRPKIADRQADFYNVNSNLGLAIDEAVTVADAVDGWSDGLVELLSNWSAMDREQKSFGMLLATPSLDLTRRDLDLTAAYGLAATVYLSDNLRELILMDNPLTDAGAAAIGTALAAKPSSPLASLHLNGTGAGERTARVLAGLIQSNRTLTELRLQRNPNLDSDAKALLQEACRARAPDAPPMKLLL